MFTVSMTKKQKECFESIFSTMESFYRNDLETLCIVIGRHYKIPDESVKNAAAIVKSLPQGVTFPVPQKADALKAIHQRWLDGGLTQKDERWIFRMRNETICFIERLASSSTSSDIRCAYSSPRLFRA